MKRWATWAGAMLLAAFLIFHPRLPAEVRQALGSAETVELLYLHPTRGPGDAVQGYPIRKKVALSPSEAGALVRRLGLGIALNPGLSARCFNPRHALRATTGGHTYEVVICFECLQMYSYRDGAELGRNLTWPFPEAAFDAWR